jgi:isoaspartyl peptidase/L-asparaginase-like protein (Ntn-hydrolase superfamily)
MSDPVIIATWKFGEIAARAALPLLDRGASALDAAIAAAQAVEDDPAVHSVGFGGIGNSAGNVQLDASVMDGRTLRCGAVAAVENIRHVAALARLVMDKTPHVLLVGEGARLFAVANGFALENLHTPDSVAAWYRRSASPLRKQPHDPELTHDTVTVLARDRTGSLAGACTTSGLSLKRHGRVGDSPIIGAGLYVDNQAGAAGGTGVGEEIMRIGGSLLIVEALRTGRDVQEACESAAARVMEACRRRGAAPAEAAFIALDPDGYPGAACTAGTDFHYAIGRGGSVEVRKGMVVS